MAKTAHIIAAGNSPKSAAAIQGGIYSDGVLTAAGTSKATALLLSGSDSYVGVVSASGKGVQLFQMDQGDESRIYNGGANAMFVYSNGSDTIINHSANAGFNVPSLKGCFFEKVTASLVMVNLSA